MTRRVALVEDNPDNRLLINAILGDGFDVTEYADGVAALAGIRESVPRPDVVLLDISLPGMDGTQVLAHLRADTRLADLYVVALTAHAMSGDRARFLGAGFDDYVTKPIVDETLLLAAIDRGAVRQ